MLLKDRIKNFGWIWIIAYIIPVYFTQPSRQFTNKKHPGYEAITFRPTGHCYFRGTHSQRNKFLSDNKERVT